MSDYKGVLHETAVRFPDTDIWMDSCGEEELDYGLARGIVGQTEDGDVGLVDVRAAGCGILAFFFAYGKQLDVRPCGKPLCDPQAGRAGGAVYKHFSHGCVPRFF